MNCNHTPEQHADDIRARIRARLAEPERFRLELEALTIIGFRQELDTWTSERKEQA